MKKLLIILILLVGGFKSFAQDDDNEKIRDKMREFIQKRLDLSRSEADRFAPIFVRYFKEWRTTVRQYGQGPRLDLQQKIVELRLRYREEFKPIIGEQRSNQVFTQQDIFIDEMRKMIKEKRMNDRPNNKRFRSALQ